MTTTYDDPVVTMDGSLPVWGERFFQDLPAAADYAVPGGMAVHPTSRWVAIAHDSEPYLQIVQIDPAHGFVGESEAPDPPPDDVTIRAVAWHPGGRYLAVVGQATGADNVFLYDFNPAAETHLVQTDSLEVDAAVGVAFSGCGEFLAIADGGAGRGRIFGFDRLAGEVGDLLVSAALDTPARSVAWSHGYDYGEGEEVTYVAWAHDRPDGSDHYVTVFPFHRRSRVLGPALHPPMQPAGVTDDAGTVVAWSSDDRALAATIDVGSNQLFVWAFDEGFREFTKYTSATAGGLATDLVWLRDDRSIVTTVSNVSRDLSLWPVQHGALVIGDPITVPAAQRPDGNARAVAVFGDGPGADYLLVSHDESPFVAVLPLASNTPFDGPHVQLSGTMFPSVVANAVFEDDFTPLTIVAAVRGDTWASDLGVYSELGEPSATTADFLAGIGGTNGEPGGLSQLSPQWILNRVDPFTIEVSLDVLSDYDISSDDMTTLAISVQAFSNAAGDVQVPGPTIVPPLAATPSDGSDLILQTSRHIVWLSPEVGFHFFVNVWGDIVCRRTHDGGRFWNAPVRFVRNQDVVALDIYYERWAEKDWKDDEFWAARVHLLWGSRTTKRFEYCNVVLRSDPDWPIVARDREVVATVPDLQQGPNLEAACTLTKVDSGVVAAYRGIASSASPASYGIRRRNAAGEWEERTELSAVFSEPEAIHHMMLWPYGRKADGQPTHLMLLSATFEDDEGFSYRAYDQASMTWTSGSLGGASAISGRNVWAGAFRISDARVIVAFWDGLGEDEDNRASLHLVEFRGPATAPAPYEYPLVVEDGAYVACCALTVDQGNDNIFVAYGDGTSEGSLESLDIRYKKWDSVAGPPDAPGDPDWLGPDANATQFPGNFELLVSDPGSANRGIWPPLALRRQDGGLIRAFAGLDHLKQEVNGDWFVAVPLTGVVLATWHLTEPYPPFDEVEQLDLSNKDVPGFPFSPPSFDPSIYARVRRGRWFSHGWIKVTKIDEDNACDPHQGQRKQIEFQIRSDSFELLGSGRAAHSVIDKDLVVGEIYRSPVRLGRYANRPFGDDIGAVCDAYGGPGATLSGPVEHVHFAVGGPVANSRLLAKYDPSPPLENDDAVNSLVDFGWRFAFNFSD